MRRRRYIIYQEISVCNAGYNEIKEWEYERSVQWFGGLLTHYPPTLHEEIDTGRSRFFEYAISPKSLFNTVIIQLRSGLQASKKQRHRYIYYYSYDFPVGVFPDRQGGLWETNTIKIVCTYIICQKCNRHLPSKVITTYPCEKPFIWIRNTAKQYVVSSVGLSS